MENKNISWIIKASTKLYDHVMSFQTNGFIDWSQKVDYKIGDIVYVCLVGSVNGIKIKSKVTKINLSSNQVLDDREFWKEKGKYYSAKSGKYARLELVEILDNEIPIKDLIYHGMPIDIPFIQKVSTAELLNFIEDSFEEKNFDLISDNSHFIPSHIKQAVWKKHNGRCAICGSDYKIHYDHIIPHSKGGTSTDPKNIQILCEKCNLKKSDKIE